mgnify:CR=1 FL=1
MTLRFCKKCKTLLVPHKEDGDFFLKCTGCGFIEKENKIIRGSENIPGKEKIGEGVLSDENLSASYENICEKCGHNKAQILDMGVFISDEDNLILLKCGKCGFSERIGRRTS